MKTHVKRCLGQNHHAIPHNHIQSSLRTVRHQGTPLQRHEILVIDVVFHVLSPLPGIPAHDTIAIQRQLSVIVANMNRDYARQCDNFDNAEIDCPLFKPCAQLANGAANRTSGKQGGATSSKNNQRRGGKRISDLFGAKASRESDKHTSAAADVHVVNQRAQKETDPEHLVSIYQEYLRRAADTQIRFVNRGEQNRISLHKHEKLTELIERLDPDDPDVSTKLNNIIKVSSAGGSNRVDGKQNIWIVQLPGSLLGYSTFPWEYQQNPSFDGVVINNQVAGVHFRCTDTIDYRPYNRYKTFSHETAHWLGCFHTFEDHIAVDPLTHQSEHDDYVNDTPHQSQPTEGNPYESHGWPVDSKGVMHMFMNHMDYTNDVAMFMFTQGQAKRMQLSLQAFRRNYYQVTTVDQLPASITSVLDKNCSSSRRNASDRRDVAVLAEPNNNNRSSTNDDRKDDNTMYSFGKETAHSSTNPGSYSLKSDNNNNNVSSSTIHRRTAQMQPQRQAPAVVENPKPLELYRDWFSNIRCC
jgi:hypothetical protein